MRPPTFASFAKLASVAVALAVPLALVSAKPAQAFCGFYVSGADAKLFADATQVVLMREGTKTVLSMQNDYKGPPEKFALVIPVPVILSKETVKVVPRAVFDKIDKLGAPRLVEYWEQDPCPKDLGLSGIGEGGGGTGQGIGLGGIGTIGHGAGLGVTVEAKFDVGEYEIVILSAKDAAGLDTWLKQEKYAIPEGAEPFFRPYVASGMKFFVAKVDPAKVKLEGGRALLSPLRFHYDSEKLALPVRLGLINSSGKQDLIVNVLAKRQRYEVANYPNVTIPTNLDVSESARGRFGEFYANLFDATLERTPRAVVTEYAWDAGTCDPCPGPTLDGNDLATLGADVLPGGTEGLQGTGGSWGGRAPGLGGVPSLRPGPVQSKGLPPEVVQRVVRRNFGRFRFCYEGGLRTNPKLAGKVETKLTIDKTGSVSRTEDGASTLADVPTRQCIQRAFTSLTFPVPEASQGGTASITYSLLLAPPDPNAPAPSIGGLGGMGFGGMATPYVLTRMHLRYDKTSLGDDLVFRAAPAIMGGREVRPELGVLERGARATETNNFQARYAIRHPWTGPVACKEPRRGVWGGPPEGTPRPTPVPAQKLAFAPRGAAGAGLGAFVSGPIDGLGATPPSAAGAADGGAPAASPPDASATPSATPPPPVPVPPKRGCDASGLGSGVPGVDARGALAMVAALALRWARRRTAGRDRPA